MGTKEDGRRRIPKSNPSPPGSGSGNSRHRIDSTSLALRFAAESISDSIEVKSNAIDWFIFANRCFLGMGACNDRT
jgi:hypothetical protein